MREAYNVKYAQLARQQPQALGRHRALAEAQSSQRLRQQQHSFIGDTMTANQR